MAKKKSGSEGPPAGSGESGGGSSPAPHSTARAATADKQQRGQGSRSAAAPAVAAEAAAAQQRLGRGSQATGAQPPLGALDPEAAAYLEALQREAPEACAALDLPLARALVAALHRRRGVQNQGAHNITPAQLAARLVFLASEAGVEAKDVRRVYSGRLENLYFSLDTARAALGWLRQQGLTPDQLQRTVAYPRVWNTTLGALAASKAGLQRLFGLSDAEWAAKVSTKPNLLTVAPASAQAMVDWLRSPAVGMDAAGVRRQW